MNIYDYITEKEISLPMEMEKNMEKLKENYLRWVYSFGEKMVEGSPVRDYFVLEGFSFWWPTLIAEKSFFKSPKMYSVFKLLAIEFLYKEKKPEKITLFSDDRSVEMLLADWAKSKNVEFVFKKTDKGIRTKSNAKTKLMNIMPGPIQALGWLANLVYTRVRKVGLARKDKRINDNTILTYFPNINPKLANEGVFKSHYWENLHELLGDLKINVNWLLVYSHSKEYSFEDTVELKNKFEDKSDDRFFLIEEFIDYGIIVTVLRKYISLYLKGRKLMKSEFFKLENSDINFYSAYKEDWSSSVMGKTLLENILWHELFKKIFKNMPKQKTCLYLSEMIGFEKILNHVCRKEGITSIGFQHTPLKMMDLRYFDYKSTYQDKSEYSISLPDILAVTSELAKIKLMQGGYPESRLSVVEAIRYLYLSDLKNTDKKHPKTLLVLTGYKKNNAEFQLRLLNEVLGEMKTMGRIWIKSHPDVPVNDILHELGLEEKVEVKKEHLSCLLTESDFVFTSNETATCIESLYMGIPTACAISADGINLSPLIGSDASFIHSGSELLDFVSKQKKAEIAKDILFIDKTLKKWRELLNENMQ